VAIAKKPSPLSAKIGREKETIRKQIGKLHFINIILTKGNRGRKGKVHLPPKGERYL
jgi:hypothetical protein